MAATVPSVVSLESGDRLTRDEFHRRYCARPDIRKAELVAGVVYLASPTRNRSHGRPHGLMVMWLSVHASRTPGVELAAEATVLLGDDSEVQPDACLYRIGGSARETDDDYIDGAPELIVEVTASSASYDLHDKMEVYRRAGVQEYVVWRTLDAHIDWFRLHEGRYQRLEPDEHGVIASEAFPSLRLAVASMLEGDRAGVLAALTEHTGDR